ncbi:hypothetical protein JTB14_029736 [Gonioctena quinquepunctata]|nr:hypothetical protein JTB14_029736 [Gonioctena quinquepunctata]
MVRESIIRRSFRYNILIMKIFGIYPWENWPKIYKFYAYFVYVFFTAPIPILAVTHIIVKEKDMEEICYDAFLVVQLGVLLVKLLPFKINPEGIIRTVERLEQNIFNSYSLDQEKLLGDAINEFNFIFNGLFTASVASIST